MEEISQKIIEIERDQQEFIVRIRLNANDISSAIRLNRNDLEKLVVKSQVMLIDSEQESFEIAVDI